MASNTKNNTQAIISVANLTEITETAPEDGMIQMDANEMDANEMDNNEMEINETETNETETNEEDGKEEDNEDSEEGQDCETSDDTNDDSDKKEIAKTDGNTSTEYFVFTLSCANYDKEYIALAKSVSERTYGYFRKFSSYIRNKGRYDNVFPIFNRVMQNARITDKKLDTILKKTNIDFLAYESQVGLSSIFSNEKKPTKKPSQIKGHIKLDSKKESSIIMDTLWKYVNITTLRTNKQILTSDIGKAMCQAAIDSSTQKKICLNSNSKLNPDTVGKNIYDNSKIVRISTNDDKRSLIICFTQELNRYVKSLKSKYDRFVAGKLKERADFHGIYEKDLNPKVEILFQGKLKNKAELMQKGQEFLVKQKELNKCLNKSDFVQNMDTIRAKDAIRRAKNAAKNAANNITNSAKKLKTQKLKKSK